MTKTILMGASVLAMLVALPAFAETKVHAESSTEAKLENAEVKTKDALDRAGKSIERTAEKAEAKAKDAYNDVKAYFNEKTDDAASVNVNASITADKLLGMQVEDHTGKNIGSIEDILVSADGDAETVIINDNALGLGGKLAAFDYDVIEGMRANDNAAVKLTEADIKAAKRFEYKAEDAKGEANILIMPAGQFSVKKISDAKVFDANGKAVADVDTVAFKDDDAEYVIVTFNKILGVGGDKAALNMEALDLAQKPNGDYAFTLTQKQSAQFENAKDAKKAN